MMNRARSVATASSGRNVASMTMPGKNRHHDPRRTNRPFAAPA
jgi:hypothetical protein